MRKVNNRFWQGGGRQRTLILPACAFASALCASTPVFASDAPKSPEQPAAKVRVAAFNLDALAGVEPKLAELVSEYVVSEARKPPGQEVVGVKELEAMLGYEQKKQLAGCTDTSCAVAIGGAFGVDKILMGSLGKVGQSHFFNLKLIDVKSARVERQFSHLVQGGTEEGYFEAARKGIMEVFGTGAPGRAEGDGGLGHGGQFSLTLHGHMDLRATGAASGLSLGYAFADWIELAAGAHYGAHLIVKPRLTGFVYNLTGAVKPYILAQGTVAFTEPVAAGVGGGVGVQWDITRNFGVMLDVPVEYFFKVPEELDSAVVLLFLGLQGRIF
jgi:hypothetical protein